MRKAALIVGIVCAVFAVLAAVMKLTGFPGGSFLFLIFTSIFSVVALPLHLASLFKETKNGMRRASLLVTWFGLAALQIGLLFAAMSWPGPFPILVQGVVFSLVALVLFMVSSKKEGVVTRWFSPFTVLVVIVFASLSTGWTQAQERIEFGEEHLATYHVQDSAYAELMSNVAERSNVFHGDTANVSVDSAARIYFDEAFDVITYIEELKAELANSSNHGLTPLRAEQGPLIHPDEYDTPSWFMVGPDVQNPTGKGMELYDRLWRYRSKVLHADVAFGIPVKSTMVDKEQWVKDNFYHVPAIDALTRLTVVQQNILQSVSESMDKKLFVQKQ
ncbi:MAG TPA: hypothetical protein VK826_12805 [Bacteroidia bacterium]|nr:hypothetical protein [Bacteroidia bacterium]